MPRTLDNHLVGVTTNAPHPESYCPDLPLLLVENPQGKRDATARLRRQSEKPSA
jgi:hypothetical protein